MRTKAALQPLTPPARTYAQLEFIHATAFCTWLADHGHHPDQLSQNDLDGYYTGLKIGHRQSLRGFLNWTMTSRNLPKLTVARTRFATGEALTQTQRLDLLRRLRRRPPAAPTRPRATAARPSVPSPGNIATTSATAVRARTAGFGAQVLLPQATDVPIHDDTVELDEVRLLQAVVGTGVSTGARSGGWSTAMTEPTPADRSPHRRKEQVIYRRGFKQGYGA